MPNLPAFGEGAEAQPASFIALAPTLDAEIDDVNSG